jgi:hypothetical protein
MWSVLCAGGRARPVVQRRVTTGSNPWILELAFEVVRFNVADHDRRISGMCGLGRGEVLLGARDAGAGAGEQRWG